MPSDPFNLMWEDACELLEQAERLQRQFFRRTGCAARRPAWQPPIDIFETTDALAILVALPGVAQVEVSLDAGALIVRGESTAPDFAYVGRVRRLEIPHGWFERRIDLPPGHYELHRQELRHGCLELLLHKLKDRYHE